MNTFSLLFFPLDEALLIVTKENNKTRVCSAYIPKIDLNTKNPKVSKSKV